VAEDHRLACPLVKRERKMKPVLSALGENTPPHSLSWGGK